MNNLSLHVPVKKGNTTAFTCLGNWYDLSDPASMDSLRQMLKRVKSKRDLHTAQEELQAARERAVLPTQDKTR